MLSVKSFTAPPSSGLRKISDNADFSRPLLLAINSGKMGRRRTAGQLRNPAGGQLSCKCGRDCGGYARSDRVVMHPEGWNIRGSDARREERDTPIQFTNEQLRFHRLAAGGRNASRRRNPRGRGQEHRKGPDARARRGAAVITEDRMDLAEAGVPRTNRCRQRRLISRGRQKRAGGGPRKKTKRRRRWKRPSDNGRRKRLENAH